ncbi:MAG: M4 family metallopeptidase [Bacteroidetes bacterium]|nr:M4 family metallopeptidase [Bacteroidota bacterium]
MKKNLLLVCLLLIATTTFSQQSLKSFIDGPKGTSKHFVTLQSDQHYVFDPSDARNILGLDPNSGLVLMNVIHDELGEVHYRFYQTYLNIPIENTMYIVKTANQKILGLSGVIITNFSTDMQKKDIATIKMQSAIDAAVNFVHAKIYMWQDAFMEQRLSNQPGYKNASFKPTAKLVWYCAGEELDAPKLRLAYKVDVYAKEPLSRADYFVDAQTGEILGKKDKLHYSDAVGTANTQYSGSKTIHSDKNGSTYRLWDLTRGNGVITLHGDKTSDLNYKSNTPDWTLKGQSQHAMDVHYGVEETYDFYKSKFNRNSLDDNGLALISYVNDGETDNAHWDGTSMNFGIRSTNSKGVTGIDVTGHELTHGVTQYTSGLIYSNESGAMNESMSDIMGKSVQFVAKPNDKNWKMSNDMGWIIRDMSNPKSQGQPDTYLGNKWYSGSSDNGGVHTNSGVGNFMFYLLVDGGSGTNDNGDSYNVSSIGLGKADKIIYRTETVYLTPTSQYNDWREACVNAATDLYGANSKEVKQVKNAWHAVGVGDYYCYSYGVTTYYMYNKKVTFSNINNNSGNNNGYGNYTNLTANVTKGKTYQITLTAAYPTGTIYQVNWNVYIDYNQDGDFNDANELAAIATSSTTSSISRFISIPSNALTGQTLMRVQMFYTGANVYDPCGVGNDGEVEDYVVNISNGSNISSEAPLAATKTAIKDFIIRPNPITRGGNAVISYTASKQGRAMLKILDVYGRVVQTQDLGQQHPGLHSYTLNFEKQLTAGNYFVTIEQENNLIAKTKIIIIQ